MTGSQVRLVMARRRWRGPITTALASENIAPVAVGTTVILGYTRDCPVALELQDATSEFIGALLDALLDARGALERQRKEARS